MSESKESNDKKSSPPKRKWLRRIVLFFLLLILLAGAGYVSLMVMANNRLAAGRFTITPPEIEVEDSDDARKRGKYLAEAVMLCTECHGQDLGGAMMIEDGVMATLAAPNLTTGKGGVAGQLTVQQWIAAIRFGVGHDGRALMIMPSEDYWWFGDDDIGAIIAYIKSVAPVDRELPSRVALGPIGNMLVATNQMPLHAETLTNKGERPAIPERGETREWGGHLSKMCIGCHNAKLTGGPVPGADPSWPPSLNITPHESAGIGKWNQEQFFTAMRTGVTPDGRNLDKKAMPWPGFKNMTDQDLNALWLFLRSVQPDAGATN